jgi:SAM-dependent methyltransferase
VTRPEAAAPSRAGDWVAFCERIMRAAGRPLDNGARVLDFGSGDGAAVAAFAAAGYDAYGCDFDVPAGEPRLRAIEQPYRLPFADGEFEFVSSNQVLEHVQDHDIAFREISRVLAPGGSTLHFFPARWRPIEPHVFVPLATVVTAKPWLSLWARVGIRNQFQSGRSAREVAGINHDYLRDQTNYIGRSALARSASRWFAEVSFVEELTFRTSRRRVLRLLGALPGVPRVYGALDARLMLMRR